jgi:putative two-component system response regulator
MTGLATDQKNETALPVLVVDDEPCLRYMVTQWLGSAGFACVEAENAEAAWEYLQNNQVHVVTLDIHMPGTPGSELLVRIKEDLPDTEVIIMTARAETEIAIELLTHGAAAYLIKPVNYDELIVQVTRAVERRQLVIERRQYTRNLEDKVREQTLTIRRAHEETIHRLVNASAYRDEETGAHIKRVGLLSALLAEAAGWSAEAVEHIRMAASMHDLGKIGIPDAILQKPGRLTRDEFEIMKSHTIVGGRVLADAESPMLRMACDIALNHHERWDGTGYPNGIAESAIPQSARIVSIVDVYDALTHDRVYRPAFSEAESLEMVKKCRGTQFDPALVDLFFKILPDLRRIALENPDEAPGESCQTYPPLDIRTAPPPGSLVVQPQKPTPEIPAVPL